VRIAYQLDGRREVRGWSPPSRTPEPSKSPQACVRESSMITRYVVPMLIWLCMAYCFGTSVAGASDDHRDVGLLAEGSLHRARVVDLRDAGLFEFDGSICPPSRMNGASARLSELGRMLQMRS
jgi:hypothetical protein